MSRAKRAKGGEADFSQPIKSVGFRQMGSRINFDQAPTLSHNSAWINVRAVINGDGSTKSVVDRVSVLQAYDVPQGFNTTLMHSSSLSRNILYPFGASSSGISWVMTKLGSISPFWIRSSNGRM